MTAATKDTDLSSGPAGSSPFDPVQRSPRARALRVGAAVVVLGALAAGAWLLTRNDEASDVPAGHDHGAAAPATDSAQPVMLSAADARRIGVTYAEATVGPFGGEIRTVGQVTYDETRVKTIAPKVEGFVEALYVNYTGQPVEAGAPLLSIYSPMLVQAQEELRLATKLAQDVDAGTPEARQQAQDLVESARRRLLYWDIPRGEIAALERSGEVRKTLTLRAPFGGFVVEKNVLAGQRIMAGDPLYKVADLSTVWVEGEVFERDVAGVRVGQRVVAEFDAFPGERRAGRITYVYPTLNPETRTVRVRVELANPGTRLKPGMYATIHLTGNARANVLTVPRSAVLATGTRTLVFLTRPDGMLEPHDVVVGGANDDRIEILAGLAAGQEVVASATFLVDAESNLGTVMGGMGDMPGMELTAPAKPGAKADPHAGHARPSASPSRRER